MQCNAMARLRIIIQRRQGPCMPDGLWNMATFRVAFLWFTPCNVLYMVVIIRIRILNWWTAVDRGWGSPHTPVTDNRARSFTPTLVLCAMCNVYWWLCSVHFALFSLTYGVTQCYTVLYIVMVLRNRARSFTPTVLHCAVVWHTVHCTEDSTFALYWR